MFHKRWTQLIGLIQGPTARMFLGDKQKVVRWDKHQKEILNHFKSVFITHTRPLSLLLRYIETTPIINRSHPLQLSAALSF